MDEISFETMSDEEEEELGAHSSPSSYRDPDETESSDEAADAKKMKDSVIHTSVNFKEGESLIDVSKIIGVISTDNPDIGAAARSTLLHFL